MAPMDERNPSMDYSGQLDQMLAPYRQQAAQLTSPYATMRPDSWLAQNHPAVAGRLDNAFLNAAMTPGAERPEGFGGGLSRTFQGLLGANQYRRQQAMMQAMLPYQMLEPRLKAEDTLAQIQQRGQQAQYERQRGEWYEKRIGQMDQSKALAGPPRTDDKGGNWDRIFDPTTGRVRDFNAESQKFADELPANERPSFLNERKKQAEGSKTEVERMVDREEQAQVLGGKAPFSAEQRNAKIMDYSARMVGASTGARKGAEQPFEQTKSLVANERNRAYQSLPKPQNEIDFLMNWGMSSRLKQQYGTKTDEAYDKYTEGLKSDRQQLDKDLSAYERSKAPNKGVGFEEYKANPKLYSDEQPASNAPTNSGSNWTPNR